MGDTSYLIGIGANRGAGRHAIAEAMLPAAIAALAAAGLTVVRVAAPVATRPLGGRGRCFANTAALVATPLAPPALLALLKAIERGLGRRPGRRWGDRPADLDILAWQRGAWHGPKLEVPHRGLATRPFALLPAAALVPGWRDPATGLALRHMAARLTRGRRLPRSTARARVRSSVGRASDF